MKNLSSNYRYRALTATGAVKDLYLDIADRAADHGIMQQCQDCPEDCKQAGSGCPTVLRCYKLEKTA